jgi:hypothetical protein
LVEDLSDEDRYAPSSLLLLILNVFVGRNDYPLTEKAVQTIIEHPTALIIAGPVAIVVLFAEWVRGTYRKTSVAFIPSVYAAHLTVASIPGKAPFAV